MWKLISYIIDIFTSDNDNQNNNPTDNQNGDNPSNYLGIINTITNKSNNCSFTCKECFRAPTLFQNESVFILEQNCKTCINDYYLLFGINDCYNSSIKKLGYYLSSNDSMYHKCDIQCKTGEDNIISNKSFCTLCNYDQGYFPAENKLSSKCYNQSTIDKNYYLNESKDSYEWMLCYPSCDTCFGYGNTYFHNCSFVKKNIISLIVQQIALLKNML